MLDATKPTNRLLASLSSEDAELLRPHLRVVELAPQSILFNVGDAYQRVYFPFSGVVSLVVGLKSGEAIETAMVGRTGAIGAAAGWRDQFAMNQAIVQIAGSAAVVDAIHLQKAVQQSVTLAALLMRHEQAIIAEAQQIAACNATHKLEARLAHWLLRCRRLTDCDELTLTQDSLARIFGVRRTTVSLVASALQRSEILKYRRGHIKIIDDDGLRSVACECYGATDARRNTAFADH